MKQFKLILSILSLLSLTSCEKEDLSNVIYTSIYPVYDLTKRIVGDKYEVRVLTPNKVEPHEYEPTAKEIVALTEAKAMFINGLKMESYYDVFPDSLKDKTYIVSKDIETKKVDNIIDSHIWLSTKNAISEMNNILDYMKIIDEENYSYYLNNYNNEVSKFTALYNEYQGKFEAIKNKYLLVSHAAFNYLCSDFNLTQIYISGLSSYEEPSAKTIENVIKKANEYHISTIFYEEEVTNEVAKKIAKEANLKTDNLYSLETNAEDDEDYLSLMRINYEKILEANK